MAFVVVFGLDWVATVPPTVALTVEAFGRERAGVVFGWIFAAHQLGAAGAAWAAGAVRNAAESYEIAPDGPSRGDLGDRAFGVTVALHDGQTASCTVEP